MSTYAEVASLLTYIKASYALCQFTVQSGTSRGVYSNSPQEGLSKMNEILFIH